MISATTMLIQAVHAQTILTYQGRVMDNGTNFTGNGQFQFALVTSLNANHTALATANTPSGGYITSYTITGGGSGYVTAPTVAIFGGGGSGAAATANLSGGAVTSLTINNPGNGNYTSAPTVTIAPPPANLSYKTYWSNDGMSVNGSEPTAAVSVAVTNGLFTIGLGDTTIGNMSILPTTLFPQQTNLQLRVWFDDGTHGFSVLNPVQPLTTAPYAAFANYAYALYSNGQGGNTAGGFDALYSNTSGSGNAANGDYALFSNTTGGYNTANGFQTLYHNTTAYFNTANGDDALYLNTTGYENTANGYQSLFLNSIGFQNTANGEQALYSNSSGYNNTANGEQALYSNTTGYNNTANGAAALYYNASGFNNTANGYNSLFSNTNGTNNTANGYQTLYENTSGTENIADGDFALFNNTSGCYNQAVGNSALYSLVGGGEYHDPFGSAATSSYNTALGGYTLFSLINGSGNIAVGYNSGSAFRGNESGNIDIGNNGESGDSAIIRIGYAQTATYLSGSVYSQNIKLTSDRNAKENFTPINAQSVLEKVASLPITIWNFKKESKDVQHLGPMAQDFQAAFGLDVNDDKHISVVDEGGVALAAIQGLNQKVNEKDVKIQEQSAEITDLKTRLDKLEQLISAKIGAEK